MISRPATPSSTRAEPIPRDFLNYWIYGEGDAARYTQDSPVLPDVWMRYAERGPAFAAPLLLTAHTDSTAAGLAAELDARIRGATSARDKKSKTTSTTARVAYSESYVVADLTLEQLVRCALPLSQWWYTRVWDPVDRSTRSQGRAAQTPPRGDLATWALEHQKALQREPTRRQAPGGARRAAELDWFIKLIGRLQMGEQASGEAARGAEQQESAARTAERRLEDDAFKRGAELVRGLRYDVPSAERPLLWSVSINRSAHTALWRSRQGIKADAVERLFDASCAELRWAIVDTGVDARHPAFRRRTEEGRLLTDNQVFTGKPMQAGTRVVATYDFTRLREIVADDGGGRRHARPASNTGELKYVRDRLKKGRAIDWDTLEPLLRIGHDETHYVTPVQAHGTHVAGILGGDWRTADGSDMPSDRDLVGICPDIELYDLRVFDREGEGDEFAITAALQFIRHLNDTSDLQHIHGVNLSLSLVHDVRNYAVGRTPVCDECERLVGAGVCVVAAAGNDGRATYRSEAGQLSDGYRTVSITDPGNTQRVITVGSTHRYEPHTYGVSFFSSRGPTGDGRPKPDLVAPGEKITSAAPDGDYETKDGTSQAAPHVAGAAALLMARYPELRGQPDRIKEILCSSATDLGRDRNFQGAGMVDVLRAIQAV